MFVVSRLLPERLRLKLAKAHRKPTSETEKELSSMALRKGTLVVLTTIFAFRMIAFAQEPQSPTASPEGMRGRDQIERLERRRERLGRREGQREHRKFGRRGGLGHFLRDLNLSEEQRQQSRAIVQRRRESTKAQREELFKLREKRIAGAFSAEDEARAKALHDEIRTSMQGVRSEMESILTAEQKAKLEEVQKERKARMEQRMQEGQQRLQERQNNRP